ncbi:hypothetical protein ACHAPT_010536 [Fusarium lateritium]
MAQQWRGVRLEQVNATDASEAEPDVDIIAVHGLDTKSLHTWTWRPKDRDKPAVNWLADSHMLPARVQRVRIFTCDWPADLFQDLDSTPWTVEEFARRLLAGIQSMRQALAADGQAKDRPILFIASCLGGIILMKALVMADNPQGDYISIRKATCGIVFLATPFRGTAFQDVAAWAEPMLKAWASLRRRSVTQLLSSVKGSTFDLEELVRTFTRLCQDKYHPCQVHTFYEKKVTILQSKVLPPYLLPLFGQEKLLVDSSSANLDIVEEPLALERRHVTMNKFFGPEDPDYDIVAGRLQAILQKIREGRPLEQADAWLRNKHYTADKLKIDRLSGDSLPMDQCYINLVIVEQVGHDAARSDRGGSQPQSSPFSLLARQKVERPDKTTQVELATMFQREGRDGQAIQPRRILIRGRAGVGKTTLCKKIVHEFYRGTWSEWTKIFDRVLWVPLRNLKLQERQEPGYNFERLFTHEYFSLPTSRPDLARELSDALAIKSNKTLFLLDGLDEVSQDLGGSGDMSRFLEHLLEQPNVIITSRPSAKPPSNMDLELETIGFYPDQVNAYLDADPNIQPRVQEVRSFLEEHWLIQGLMQIPIQLDALCYTWEDFDPGTVPDTMTRIYRAIEQRLWKKDAVRLNKKHDGEPLSASQIEPSDVEYLVNDEIYFLEGLAFTGLHNDLIDFKSRHREAISTHFKRPGMMLQKTLPSISFLRPSGPASEDRNRSYHFIHLTFQEYFAARYFVRQWKAEKPLKCLFLESQTNVDTDPVKFFRKHKYTARYDILWRFVAGLLDDERQEGLCLLRFFRTIEEEPRDLLGPTHQRLVMHCLSEVSTDMPLRQCLEENLMQWLLFECSFQQKAHLSSEMEFPESALRNALKKGSHDAKIEILDSLKGRPTIPLSVNELAPSWLRDDTSWELKSRVCIVLQTSRTDLTNNVLAAVVQRLDDEHSNVRKAALEVLQKQSSLSDEILTAVVQRLDDKGSDIQWAAREVLRQQSSLSDDILTVVIQQLNDEDWHVRQTALEVLQRQSSLSDEILTAVVQRLNDEDWHVRGAALGVLQKQSSLFNEILSDEILAAIVQRLDDEHWGVRQTALEVLQKQSSLSDEILTAVIQRLNNEDWHVRQTALEVLQRQSSLSDEILTAVVQRLNDEDWHVREAALRVLQKQSSLSDKILTAVVQRLGDKRWHVRRAAQDVLQRQWGLSNENLTAVVQRLDNEDSGVRQTALEVLQKQSSLSDEILIAVIQRLNDEHWHVREAALRVLQKQSSLSDEILTAVVQRLNDEDWHVREAALRVLQKQSSLFNKILSDEILAAIVQRLDDEHWGVRQTALEILAAIVQRLDDEHWGVRQTALEVLQKQSSLSDEILTAVVQRLNDEDWHVREAALRVLQKQSSLSDEILTAVIQRLNNEDSGVRQTALEVLQKWPSLSDEILIAVVQRLNDEDWHVRRAAQDVLQRQSSLSDEILTAVVQRLNDEDWDVREAALEVLQEHPSLSDEILIAVVQRLNDEDWHVRRAAQDVLQKQLSLSDEILIAVVQRLDDEYHFVRRAALKVLQKQPSLSDEILIAVVQRLDDEDSGVQWVALKVLQKQSSLSDELLTAVARQLESESAGTLAEAVLRKHETFYSTLLSGPHAESLFKVLLRRAFEEQWSWYVEDGRSCINTPDGVRYAGIENMEEFMDMVNKARPPSAPQKAVG